MARLLYLRRFCHAQRPGDIAFLQPRTNVFGFFLENLRRQTSALVLPGRCRMRGMAATDQRVTYAEMLEWPDDGRRYELYDGEVVVVPSPFPRHQQVAFNIAELLRRYADVAGGLMHHAPLDIVLSEHNVLQPDVLYFSKARRHLVKDWEVTRAAPDLAVEVLSQSTESRDRGRKMELLARFGVPEYWIVDPAANTLEIRVLRGTAYELAVTANADDVVASPTLTDLTFAASRMFAA